MKDMNPFGEPLPESDVSKKESSESPLIGERSKTNHWVIYISGYGCFYFEGTRKEAEEMRRHKANWEGGLGRKRPATPDEIMKKDTDTQRIQASENVKG